MIFCKNTCFFLSILTLLYVFTSADSVFPMDYIATSTRSSKEIYNITLESKNFYSLNYRKIKANQVIFKTKQQHKFIQIKVNNSASPLIYKFETVKNVKEITLKAHLKGSINYKNQNPGDKGADDFPLKIGLIIKGNKKLNFFQRQMAPNWLKRLDKIAKDTNGASGFSHVENFIFYTKKPQFQRRLHPLSKYFIDNAIAPFKNSQINITFNLKKDFKVIGLWINVDGDDTNSIFELDIHEISLR